MKRCPAIGRALKKKQYNHLQEELKPVLFYVQRAFSLVNITYQHFLTTYSILKPYTHSSNLNKTPMTTSLFIVPFNDFIVLGHDDDHRFVRDVKRKNINSSL